MSVSVYYNPLDIACKSVTGAIRIGDALQFRVFLLKDDICISSISGISNFQEYCRAPVQNAFFNVNRDGEESESFLMNKTPFGWTITVKMCQTGLFYYGFSVENEGFVSRGKLEQGTISLEETRFLLTAYEKDYETPDWFKGGVMYQIFPDRFCRVGTMPNIEGRVLREDWGGTPYFRPNEQGKVLNNDFFGGNLKGIQSKLPYLRALGVTVLYMNPIFEAASNHRYDTSDYKKIDPMLGTEKDFSDLVVAADACGIKIILDGVFNHTGDDSLYFNKYGHYPSVGAYQSKASPYYDWYTFQNYPEKYSSWWGIDILPALNETSESYQNFIFSENGVLHKWLEYGIGGYRLDVADELPDFFLRMLRASVKKKNPQAIVIGEVWEDASDKIAYSERREYLQGRELDSVMNYPLKDAVIAYILNGNATDLLQTIYTLIDHYPKATLDCLMNILGTHDTARILTVIGGISCKDKEEMASPNAVLSKEAREKAIQLLKMAVILQFTLPGVPCIYYGDENAMEGHIDPFCRKCFDWENQNEDLQLFYRRLGQFREENRAVFKDGIFEAVDCRDGLLFFKRENIAATVYVYTNNSEKSYYIETTEKLEDCFTHEVLQKGILVLPKSYGLFKKL